MGLTVMNIGNSVRKNCEISLSAISSCHRIITAFVVPFFILLCATGCGRGNDYRRDDPDTPGNGGREEPIKPPSNPDSIQRPGVGEGGYDFSKELTDATWRYVGDGIDLRYSTPGILFKTADTSGDSKSVEIIDLDGTERIQVRIGSIASDSLVTAPAIIINDREVGLKRMKLKKTTTQATWYHIITTESANITLVTPGN